MHRHPHVAAIAALDAVIAFAQDAHSAKDNPKVQPQRRPICPPARSPRTHPHTPSSRPPATTKASCHCCTTPPCPPPGVDQRPNAHIQTQRHERPRQQGPTTRAGFDHGRRFAAARERTQRRTAFGMTDPLARARAHMRNKRLGGVSAWFDARLAARSPPDAAPLCLHNADRVPDATPRTHAASGTRGPAMVLEIIAMPCSDAGPKRN